LSGAGINEDTTVNKSSTSQRYDNPLPPEAKQGRGNWLDSLGRDPLHPVLPRPGCGYSVLSWANRFLRLYIDHLAMQKQTGDAIDLIQVLDVFAMLENNQDGGFRRRETQAYEALSEHYDHLRASAADESLIQAFQLLLLLMMAVDQLRKQGRSQGLVISYASVEEVLDEQLRNS
jgi:hypothetical protein